LAEQTNQEELAIRYLLGGLSENEETTLEERLLADDELFEDFEIAEEELIDRYVRDELSPDERQRVQEMILNSHRIAERVEIARIFAQTVASPAPQQDEPQPAADPAVKEKKKETPKIRWWNLFAPSSQIEPAMRLVAVAPLALLLVTGVVLVMVWTNYRAESQRWAQAEQRLSELQQEIADQNAKRSGLETTLTQTQQERTEQEKLIADLQQQLAEQGRQAPSVFSFFLNPSLGTRSGGNAETKIFIPPGKTQLELQLNVESGDYRQYVAILQDINFKPIGRHQRLTLVRKGGRKFIPFKVPVSLIPPGSYLVHVDGVVSPDATENFTDYQFRVTAR